MRTLAFVRARALPAVCLGLGLSACFGHHTADEEVLIPEPAIKYDAGSGGGIAGRDSGTGAADCSKETDPIASLLCSLGGGGAGGITDLIDGLLGGGMSGQNCAKETDPIAQLLCGITGTGGGGIEGLLAVCWPAVAADCWAAPASTASSTTSWPT